MDPGYIFSRSFLDFVEVSFDISLSLEEVSSEQQEKNPSLLQEEPHLPQSASTPSEMGKQADVEDSEASKMTNNDQFLFSRNNIMNQDEWEEARDVQAALNNKMSYYQELKSANRAKPMIIQIAKKSKKRKRMSKIPVSCTICGKSVYDMNTHMESHTGRKYFPYRCRICAEGFKLKSEYWPHYLKCIHCFHGKLYTGI